MNPFRRMVTVGHNARVFDYNRRPTEWEETAKRRSEGDMQRDAFNWRRARSNPPPGCLWQLSRSASTLTELFCPDGNLLCWCCMIAQTLYDSIQHLIKCCFRRSGCRPRTFSSSHTVQLLHNRCLCILNSLSCHSGLSPHIILDPFLFLFIAQNVRFPSLLHWKLHFRS